MTSSAPQRPFWKRKRWRFVIAAWLLLPIVYVATTGPVLYAETIGWLPDDTYLVTFRPLHRLISAVDRGSLLYGGVRDYTMWWADLALGQGQFRSIRLTD
jgi:hypothetical protein